MNKLDSRFSGASLSWSQVQCGFREAVGDGEMSCPLLLIPDQYYSHNLVRSCPLSVLVRPVTCLFEIVKRLFITMNYRVHNYLIFWKCIFSFRCSNYLKMNKFYLKYIIIDITIFFANKIKIIWPSQNTT